MLPTAPLSTVLCASHFGEQDGLLRIRGRKLREAPAAPFPALFWGAGLSFSRAQLILEVSLEEEGLADAVLCFYYPGSQCSRYHG